jgi:hypothetical protein
MYSKYHCAFIRSTGSGCADNNHGKDNFTKIVVPKTRLGRMQSTTAHCFGAIRHPLPSHNSYTGLS